MLVVLFAASGACTAFVGLDLAMLPVTARLDRTFALVVVHGAVGRRVAVTLQRAL